MKKLFLLNIFVCIYLHSQVIPDTTPRFPSDTLIIEEKIQDKIEQFTENTEQEQDFTEISENLQYFARHPINLNNTNYEELSRLGLLSDLQIGNLLLHIQKNGKLLSIYELQSIEGFDLPTIYRILPYIKIASEESKTSWSFRNVSKFSKSVLISRYSLTLPLAVGYSREDSSGYLGSPYKLFIRYHFSYFNLLSAGFTAEKDQGEELFRGSQKNGFDFYSAHVFLRKIGPFMALALGDYTLEFGQGLAMWTGLSFGKTSDATYIKKAGRGILPFRSVNEFNFLRGFAMQMKLFRSVYLYGFGSIRMKDGSILQQDSLSQEEFTITSLNESGLHNTYSSMNRKNNVQEKLLGGRMEVNLSRFKLGYTSYFLHFNKNFATPSDLYQMYDFTGNTQLMNSFDYSILLRNFNIFGEVAHDGSGQPAHLHGLMMAANYHYSVSVLYRNFPRDFHSFFGTPLSESSKPNNERAWYIGQEIKFSRQWILNAYMDMFQFPWLRYLVDAPSEGTEILAQLNYLPNKKTQLSLRYKYEEKNKNVSQQYVKKPESDQRQWFRFHATYPISNAFIFKTRVELLLHKFATQPLRTGFLGYQDVLLRKKNSPLSLTLRIAFFDTYSYDERIYAYENDVLYSYTIPAYYYKGSRTYFIIKYTFKKHLDIWLRIAHTLFLDRTTIGSGLDLINQPSKTELKVQIRYTF
ncbi:MAG: helix-hairpin-helix domain-containing protein [Bacteroidales bacterium]|nr:helix-hairpin-helix domain-containing protein [Bacteroidales bacterium]